MPHTRITQPISLTLTPIERRLLYSLTAIHFFNHVDFVVMMPIGPMLARDFGINTTQFGVLVSSYNFAGAGAGLLFALMAARFERKSMLLFVLTGFIISTAACALASHYESLLIVRCGHFWRRFRRFSQYFGG
jgi:predicted MFS family arabinose efflux permease